MTIQHIKLMRRPSDFFRVRVDILKDMVNFSDEKKEKKKIEEETFARTICG